MKHEQAHLLLVDDEPINLEILTELLEDQGYQCVSAATGEEAWNIIEGDKSKFDAVLLDRMMPGVDGLDVLKRMKADSSLKHLPVIMQTAKAANSDIQEGLQAGAYYYLTKPFDRKHLLAIVNTALSDRGLYLDLEHRLTTSLTTMSFMDEASFKFRSIEEGLNIVTLISSISDKAATAAVGLSELVINAVEHGNLGISYDDKSLLIDTDQWVHEIEKRLAMDEYRDKYVRLNYRRTSTALEFTIVDEGKGFDWSMFLEMDANRIFETHGRGIAMAKMLSFDDIQYSNGGSSVTATIQL